MPDRSTPAGEPAEPDPQPARRLRLPPVIQPQDEGVGDVIARLSRSVGIKPCDACRDRQQRLNQWMPFRPR